MRKSNYYRPLYVALAVFLLAGIPLIEGGVLIGEPPSLTSELQDAFVFREDAGGNPVNLQFECQAEGNPSPNITWFTSDGEVDSAFVRADGSFFFPNITEQDTKYANKDGVEYYCTARNSFGTIRSKSVRAFYAYFAGFAMMSETVTVDVLEDRNVALECALKPGSNPTPVIEWVKCSTCDGSDDTVVVEDTAFNTIRFLNGGRYLFLVTSAAVIGSRYACRVTNKQQFQTERSGYTYRFNEVNMFSNDGFMVFKSLENISTPLLSSDSVTKVEFSLVIAHKQGITYKWTLQGSATDSRISITAQFGSVRPILLPGEDADTKFLEVKVVATAGGMELADTAFLELQRPAGITSAPKDNRDVLTGTAIMSTCEVSGTPTPSITWYHNGLPLASNGDVTVVGGGVTIRSTLVEHSGMYQCFAVNKISNVYESWTLQVRAPVIPTFSVKFSDNAVDCLDFPLIEQASPPLELVVNLTADPCPDAKWYINDTLITNITGDTEIINPCDQYVLGDTQFSYRLGLTDLNAGTTGFYTATFTNVGGEAMVDRTFVTPYFRGQIFGIESDPHHPIDNTQSCLLAGGNVEIVCANKAYPVGTVEFTKGGKPVDLSTNRVNQTCNTLEIFGVVQADAGSYLCTVDNDDVPQKSDTSGSINLVYCTAPSIMGDLTFTHNNPEEGQGTTATCSWTGSPNPKGEWLKDDKVLVESDLPDRMRISPLASGMGSELEISSVRPEDAGDYTCRVINPVGTVFQVKRLEVRGKAEALLSEQATIGISAGAAGVIVVVAVVIVLLCCVWNCAQRNSSKEFVVPGQQNNVPMVPMHPESYNVDSPDGQDEEPEAFNPDYASLPAIRPPQPPQYKPTPNYPMEVPLDEIEKVPPPDDDFVGPYGLDNGGYPGGQQPTVDDFVSDDAQFV